MPDRLNGTYKYLLCIFLAMLAGCQTTASQGAQARFTPHQIAVLTAAGFEANGVNSELGIENRVLFKFDSSELQPDTNGILVRLARTLLDVGIVGSTVEGHTDATGQQSYNQALSEARAGVVKQALVAAGMHRLHVTSLGVGESDPVASDSTDEGRRQNRRVVIIVAPADAMQF